MHIQNRTPERNDQKGAAQHPENTSWEDRKREREKKNQGRGEISTLQYLRWSWQCVVVMQDRPALQTSLLDNEGRGWERRGSGGVRDQWGLSTAGPENWTGLTCAASNIFCVRWSWDCSVLCCAGLDWDTRALPLCGGLYGPVVPLWMLLLLLVYGGSGVVSLVAVVRR